MELDLTGNWEKKKNWRNPAKGNKLFKECGQKNGEKMEVYNVHKMDGGDTERTVKIANFSHELIVICFRFGAKM